MAKRLLTRSRRRRLLFAALFLLAAGPVVYCALHYSQRVELTTYHVCLPDLPRELDGFRIVQLSDLHRSVLVPDGLIRQAVSVANRTHADIAVLTGDFVSRRASNAGPCAEMLSHIHTRHGSYAVLGNHDHWTDAGAVAAALDRHGIIVLDNDSNRIRRGFYVAGIDDTWAGRPNAARAFRRVPRGACCVMVSHSPLGTDVFRGRSGLLITGHTHGGQVQVPLIPRNRLPGLRGWKYINGWYGEGHILMYVNRGIGMVNPAVRFRCPPEVTLYVLHPADGRAPRLGC